MKTYLNKKDIDFLCKLEARLYEQSKLKTRNIKDKALISDREFFRYWYIVEKIIQNHENHIKRTQKRTKEMRKTNKGYARSLYYKEYLKDKEIAKSKGIKFDRTIADYKAIYKNK